MAEEVRSGSGTQSFVPAETTMREFTLRALLLGLVMCVILGAANAYLGLKAGMTIAATYPAAVIGMAVLRIMKGSLLEENFARTVGAIGESIAAGAVFTIPAFYIAGIWKQFDSSHYLEATAIMFVGSVVGILFVTVLRRVMVEDKELPFPESVAASEIHKAGRSGGTGAMYLFSAMGLGAAIQALGQLNFFAAAWERFIKFTPLSLSLKNGNWNIHNPIGWRHAYHDSRCQSGLCRCRLYHRIAPFRFELRRRSFELGTFCAASSLLCRTKCTSR